MRWALVSNSCWSLVLASSRLRASGSGPGVNLVQRRGQVGQHEGVRILRAQMSCGPSRSGPRRGSSRQWRRTAPPSPRRARSSSGRRGAAVRPGSSAGDSRALPAAFIRPSDLGWPHLTRKSSRPILPFQRLAVLRIGAVFRAQLADAGPGPRTGSGCTGAPARGRCASTCGLKLPYCSSYVMTAGPLMMSGVRASSIRIESTSSTMA